MVPPKRVKVLCSIAVEQAAKLLAQARDVKRQLSLRPRSVEGLDRIAFQQNSSGWNGFEIAGVVLRQKDLLVNARMAGVVRP
jgi:hypothetical protein